MLAKITIDETEYTAEYNDLRGLFGFDSSSEFYNVYVANERAILRAAFRAAEAEEFTGVNKNITVTLFPNN